jgi:hypothetical protein
MTTKLGRSASITPANAAHNPERVPSPRPARRPAVLTSWQLWTV